jgi:BCD family chlorophyll transporter-like MFS transporter
VQATSAGVAIAIGGIIRDLVAGGFRDDVLGAAAGYDLVYCLEMTLLLVTLGAMFPMLRRRVAAVA